MTKVSLTSSWLAVSLVLILSGFIIAACNSDNETSNVTPTQTTETSSTSVTPTIPPETNSQTSHTVSDIGQATFVANDTCIACHTSQAEAWRGSHHDLAMQEANADTMLGDFDDAEFTDFGVTTRFFEEDGRYFVNTEGSDGEYSDFHVKYTFGITPLQQYLLEFPNGQYQTFTIAWDTVDNRWFNLQPEERIEPDNILHWSNRYFTWNSSCAECHSTDLKLNYDVLNDTYQTSWAEIDVSCQACHGPGSEHVTWAQTANPDENYDQAEIGLQVTPDGMNQEAVLETCARCHSRRFPISLDDQHTEAYLNDFMPELLYEGVYHPDGQILEEVYVYGSFLQAKKYQQGVSCLDCHDPHSLQLRQPGKQMCMTCHQQNAPTELYPTLQAKNYNSPEHHHHELNTEGAQCVQCHMPENTYMVIDERRDHSFRIPRPDLSAEIGSPNACIQCHTEQTNEWAISAMVDWYGPAWQSKPHYGQLIAAGRTGEEDALEPLVALSQDQDQPSIVRATALEVLRGYGLQSTMQAMIAGLSDSDPLVRVMAVQGLRTLPTSQRLANLPFLLDDPVRAVRVEAARALSDIPPAQFGPLERPRFEEVLQEYTQAQLALSDHPEGHFNLGQLQTALGNLQAAEDFYQLAVRQDSQFHPAYNNLATLYYQQGRLDEAEQLLLDALEVVLNEGGLYYSYALLLAEQERMDEAVVNMALAAELLPQNFRVQYNYGLMLQRLDRPREAEAILLWAYELAPGNPDIIYAIAVFYIQQERWSDANFYVGTLAVSYPDYPNVRPLIAALQESGNPRE